MKRYDKLIFVSNSDTCRSAMAKAIMKNKFLLEALEIESRGLVSLFPEPVNQKAEAVLVSHGLSMREHESSQLKEEDLGERTLVLAMDKDIRLKICESFEHIENVNTLTEYIGCLGEVASPLGGTLADYGACFELLEELVTKLVVVLNEEELLC